MQTGTQRNEFKPEMIGLEITYSDWLILVIDRLSRLSIKAKNIYVAWYIEINVSSS